MTTGFVVDGSTNLHDPDVFNKLLLQYGTLATRPVNIAEAPRSTLSHSNPVGAVDSTDRQTSLSHANPTYVIAVV